MSSAEGAFVWYELMTTDAAAAQKFYADAVGWSVRDAGMAEQPYALFAAPDGIDAAGCLALPKEACDAGAQPFWIGYVSVGDVDAACAKTQALGGALHREPHDIPGVGRFAIIADPQGAALALMTMESDSGAAGMTPGHGGWHELYAADAPAVFDFYAQMFGWTKGEAMPMGAMGDYQIVLRDGQMIAGMMNRPAEMPVSVWGFYFVVDGVDEAAARVRAGGGQIINGPMEVPGGGWIVQGIDPQGAMFALTGPKSRG